jgi:hypothetical protein
MQYRNDSISEAIGYYFPPNYWPMYRWSAISDPKAHYVYTMDMPLIDTPISSIWMSPDSRKGYEQCTIVRLDNNIYY